MRPYGLNRGHSQAPPQKGLISCPNDRGAGVCNRRRRLLSLDVSAAAAEERAAQHWLRSTAECASRTNSSCWRGCYRRHLGDRGTRGYLVVAVGVNTLASQGLPTKSLAADGAGRDSADSAVSSGF